MESGSYNGSGEASSPSYAGQSSSEAGNYAPGLDSFSPSYTIHSAGSYNASLIAEEQANIAKILSNYSLMKFYDKKQEEKKEKIDYLVREKFNPTFNIKNSNMALDYLLNDSKFVKPNATVFDFKAVYNEELPSILK